MRNVNNQEFSKIVGTYPQIMINSTSQWGWLPNITTLCTPCGQFDMRTPCGQSDTASAPVLNKHMFIQNFYTTLLRNLVYKRGNTTSPPLFLDKGNGRNSWVHPRAEWTLTGSSKSLTSEQTKIIPRTLSCPNHPSQFDCLFYFKDSQFFLFPLLTHPRDHGESTITLVKV